VPYIQIFQSFPTIRQWRTQITLWKTQNLPWDRPTAYLAHWLARFVKHTAGKNKHYF
jgi:hypothetical protein